MHLPVLLEATIQHLIGDPHGLYVDCTLGGGGHLRALLSKLAPDARIVGIDKDREILEKTAHSLEHPGLRLVHGDFKDLDQILFPDEQGQVDGIMIDLGVSSFQLDLADRGFSYHEDALLDMRMNRDQGTTAGDLVNQLSQKELTEIIGAYGEERFASRIARSIVRRREDRPITTTLELAEIIRDSIPARFRKDKHPARRTFQALRIAVNSELQAIEAVLPQAVAALKPGGNLCVITFHSLEDRIVKRYYVEHARLCVCPPGLPICTCNHHPDLKIITRKAIAADEQERSDNPRARSAKLRVARKI